MNVLIVSGFLGSGKTTILMQLARHLVQSAATDAENKVIILENEVGEVGIDDAWLRGGDMKVETLFSGCACCSVAGELVYAVSNIGKNFSPEWLIIETTGIAYPKNIQENMKNALGLDARICIIADAGRWNRLLKPMNPLLRGQIVGADTVLINKTDLTDAENLQKIIADIRDMDGSPNIICVSAKEGLDGKIWDSVLYG
jgi:G3E family GTPase